MRSRVVRAVTAVLLVVTLAVGGWFAWQRVQQTPYEQAVGWLPEATLRATWTDWAQVRELAGQRLGETPTSRDVAVFLSRAYELDLTSTSALVEGVSVMREKYGFSPVEAEWESFGQSREGAVVVLRLEDSVDLGEVEDDLARLGYDEPADGPGSGGVWAGSADLVATIDPSLTAVMQNVVVVPDKRLVLLSDNQAYASAAADVVEGSADGLDEVEGTSALARAADEPASAVLFASDFACEALSMATADEGDQATADALVEEAGGVSPLAGLVVGLQPDRSLTVGMHFESSDQASADLRPRVTLASGESPGQGGTFAERFRVEEAVAEGSEIVMDLRPDEEDSPLMSDLTQGPLLFAAC